jgi:cytoskeletal protein CcmA (bactofilin family)
MSESVIADDLHIKGELTTKGDVELKGTVEGEIKCRTLMVSEEARIDGAASAEKVVVRGTVEGSIAGNRVTLTSSAKVKGELICKALSIDEEAYFDGRSQRVDDPLKDTKQKSADSKSDTAKGGKSEKDKDKDKSGGGAIDQQIAAGASR